MHVGLDKVKGQVINIGTGRDVAIKAIAGLVLDNLGKPNSLITHLGDRPGQVDRQASSTEKAIQILGWKAETSLDQGITETIRWYQQNPDWWRKRLGMRHVPIKRKDGKLEYY